MAKVIEIDRVLSKEEFEDLIRVRKDPVYFCGLLSILHPIRGKIKFKLFPYQVATLIAFLQNRFNIVLKFRQAGLTELIAAYCLWLAMYHDAKNIQIISIKDPIAKKVLRRIKFMYRSLPDHLKTPIVNGRNSKDLGTSSEIIFSNSSTITCIPTTEEAGRSEALSLLVIDEAAIIRWAQQIWASAFSTLSTGGRAILNSTPFGVGNFFHKMWVKAVANKNGFFPIRLLWTMHPERDLDWYNRMRSALGPRKTAQEIDGDFLTSGRTVFDLADIRALEEEIWGLEFLTIKDLPNMGKYYKYKDEILVFKRPEKGKRYGLGADVSTGRAADSSAGSMMDQAGDEQLAFKLKIPINELSDLIGRLGKIYNYALVAPESNDVGLGAAIDLQESRYPNLYYSRKLLKKKNESKPQEEMIPGWYTTSKNRSLIINDLEEDVREQNVNIKDRFFIDEAYTFIYDESNRPVAMGKGNKKESSMEESDEDTYSDDSILGKAITNFIRKALKSRKTVKPK